MIKHEHHQTYENLVYYSYKLFEPFSQVSCITSTRLGGVSEEYFHSLNLSFRVGDIEQSVITNRSRFYALIDAKTNTVVQGQLVHDAHIEIVTEQSPSELFYAFPKTDGLITNVFHRPLFLPVADCAAVAFFDPVQQIIALAHAGWKGVVARIVPKTVAIMHETFGSNPSDILVGISPSIGPCCFQVREDVIRIFTEAFPTLAHHFFLRQPDESTHLDMWTALRWQLSESNILANHIEESSICTACHTNEFYSHRAEKGKTGRFASLIALHR